MSETYLKDLAAESLKLITPDCSCAYWASDGSHNSRCVRISDRHALALRIENGEVLLVERENLEFLAGGPLNCEKDSIAQKAGRAVVERLLKVTEVSKESE